MVLGIDSVSSRKVKCQGSGVMLGTGISLNHLKCESYCLNTDIIILFF